MHAGYFIPDVVVAAIIGVVTGWCVGPLIPVCGHWLARRTIMQFLLHLSVIGLALSSQFFPYTTAAPKRVVFQHTFLTAGTNDCKKFFRSLIVSFKLQLLWYVYNY